MNPLLVLLLPLMLLFNSLSHAAHLSSTNNFIQCLNSPNIIFTPTNPSYTPLLQEYIKNSRFNFSSTPKPLLIVTPLIPSEVQSTVICAKSAALQIKIRSGGHDYEGLSYVSINPNFIILDLFNFRNISVDIPSGTAYAQAGAQMGELYYSIYSQSRTHAFPGGVCPSLGVGGHISGGGYGNMLRKFGISVDNLVDAEIVDANGRLLNRETMGEDLFWAISGGGAGSFGVVLSFTVKLVEIPETVTVFRVPRTLEQNASQIAYKWQSFSTTTDRRLFVRLLLLPNPKPFTATFISLFLGNADELYSIVSKDFPELGLKQEDCTEMTWIESVLFWADFNLTTTKPEILLNRHSDSVAYAKHKSDYSTSFIPISGWDLIFQKVMEGKVELYFNPYGGKMDEIPATAKPYAHRKGYLWKIQQNVYWTDGSIESDQTYVEQTRDLFTLLTPYVSENPRSAYLNYRDLDIGINLNIDEYSSYVQGKVYGEKYFGVNFDRLVEIKTAVDPDNFFRNEQSIPILPSIGDRQEELATGISSM